MSTMQYSRVTTMDKAAKIFIKLSFQLVNSVIALTGIAILMYSIWFIGVCRKSYPKYPWPWFLWVCLGTGTTFCSLACIGHIGADTKKHLLIDLYIVFMFMVMLVEGLITADICLNEHWDKDFPKDHTQRFDKLIDYVEDHPYKSKCIGLFIALSQVSSFLLAIIIRAMPSKLQWNNEDEEAKLPFLSYQIQRLPPPPLHCAFGHLADPHFYPPPPYMYGFGYVPGVTGNEKPQGKYVDATPPASPKGGC